MLYPTYTVISRDRGGAAVNILVLKLISTGSYRDVKSLGILRNIGPIVIAAEFREMSQRCNPVDGR